jgi:hypothetical protein
MLQVHTYSDNHSIQEQHCWMYQQTTLWYTTIEDIISSVPGVSAVTVDTTLYCNITIQTEGDLANQQSTD